MANLLTRRRGHENAVRDESESAEAFIPMVTCDRQLRIIAVDHVNPQGFMINAVDRATGDLDRLVYDAMVVINLLKHINGLRVSNQPRVRIFLPYMQPITKSRSTMEENPKYLLNFFKVVIINYACPLPLEYYSLCFYNVVQ